LCVGTVVTLDVDAGARGVSDVESAGVESTTVVAVDVADAVGSVDFRSRSCGRVPRYATPTTNVARATAAPPIVQRTIRFLLFGPESNEDADWVSPSTSTPRGGVKYAERCEGCVVVST
jgi:hypothetical protein